MKSTILYLILFSYAVLLLKPFLPYAADFMAHAFWHAEHMATVHYENGKYHVHYEVSALQKKDNAGKQNNMVELGNGIKEHVIPDKIFIFQALPFTPKANFGRYISSLSIYPKSADERPPKAV